MENWTKDNDEEDLKEDIVGYVKEWSLALYGTHGTRHDRTSLARDRKQSAYHPTSKDMAEIKKREVELARGVKVKRTEQKGSDSLKGSLQKMSNRDAEREELVESLWNLLHAHGGRNVRKRVLQPTESKMVDEQKRSRPDKLKELKRLAEELVAELDKRGNQW